MQALSQLSYGPSGGNCTYCTLQLADKLLQYRTRAGNDVLMDGGAGDDELYGGAGDDILIVDSDDTFSGVSKGNGVDIIQGDLCTTPKFCSACYCNLSTSIG